MSRSLHFRLRNTYIVATHYVGKTTIYDDALDDCDAVIVNGEGSIHHDSTRSQFLIGVLRKAQLLGKKTALVNALFQQSLDEYRDVLERLDFFSVREPASAENAKRLGGRPIILLDSAADPHFPTNSGKVLRNLPEIVKGDTHPLSTCRAVLDSLDVDSISLKSISFEDLVATLRTAKVYVTGQHHGVYAAGLAGIGFVPIPSNSHKIESLVEWSGLPIPICRRQEDLGECIAFAVDNQTLFKRFQQFLREHRVVNERDFSAFLH